jgi:uncharacterized protein YaeQ
MSTTPDQLTVLLEELGSQAKVASWVSFNSEALAWTVGFEDDAAVLLEWDEELERVMVFTPLGRPPEHRLVTVYRAVLAYNALWRENAGARIVMADTEGELALMFELSVRTLTLERLQLVLESVRHVARTWARYVLDAEDVHEALPPGSPPSLRV